MLFGLCSISDEASFFAHYDILTKRPTTGNRFDPIDYQFLQTENNIIGNPDLKPEIGDHYEIGIENQQKLPNATLTLSMNAFHNEIKNLISLAVFNNHGVLRKYSNISSYNNWMLNTQVKWKNSFCSFQAGIGYTFVEKSLIFPKHSILELTNNLSLTIKKYQTSIHFNYKYNSKQPVVTVDNQFLYTNPIHIANVSLQKSMMKNTLQCQVGVKNLFNLQNTALNGAASSTEVAHMRAITACNYFLQEVCLLN